ncbi:MULTISPECIES: tripartite tricarboxylate transporter substrate binding protein [unclassified Polynucleobacter]|jgi:tripartite-type tricarboxylate transporter receptor subunit TctC|uniref:Bug family tripartite tricarboxylate transporter substrate binding protein n=1 Tax=unclassified Polynucleobacter TaxID=2640945 RepID=UPI001BFE4F62|nr:MULTISPECIES: tripartite tricarboxylate transporter substrate binding protein [unclassified Polynucleobacter]MBU3558686.1 tripartite tricarboxylate transporter substrate binding protein [Polynucleobacter sp. Nonnen-W13]QWE31358.1 tripartite tricarboxylate transporter substrate binding protein [Polynucleobacter sp. Adler-ghost]
MMKKSIKKIVLSSLVLPLVLGTAFASYPDKPIKMLVGYAPGSSTDIVGRMVANELSIALKQSVIVENRGGAAGSLAADAVAKSAPDGYTVLFAQNGLAINVAANPRLPFNGQKDLLPVVGVAATPHILIVNTNSKAKNVADLISMLRADPGKMSFGSSGIGNSDHMAGELFLATTGTQAIHIPYKGGSPAATDLVGGQIDFYFAGMPVGLPLYKGEKVNALAVTSKNRFSGAPELVTIQEAGVKGYEMALWQGMFVPAGTPPAIINTLSKTILKILETPEMKERFVKAGVQIAPMTTQQFTDLYVSDIARWKVVIEKAKIKLD